MEEAQLINMYAYTLFEEYQQELSMDNYILSSLEIRQLLKSN